MAKWQWLRGSGYLTVKQWQWQWLAVAVVHFDSLASVSHKKPRSLVPRRIFTQTSTGSSASLYNKHSGSGYAAVAK
jgi:hypothetical protein